LWVGDQNGGTLLWLLCKSFAKQLWLKDKSTGSGQKGDEGPKKTRKRSEWQMEICFPFPPVQKKKHERQANRVTVVAP